MITNKNSGLISLIAILTISAVALLVSLSVSFLGTEEGYMSLTQNISSKGSFTAQTCLNEALARIRSGKVYEELTPVSNYDVNLPLARLYGCSNNSACVSDKDEDSAVSIWTADSPNSARDLYNLGDPSICNATSKINQVSVGFLGFGFGESPEHKGWTVMQVLGEEEIAGNLEALPGMSNKTWFYTSYNKTPAGDKWDITNISSLIAGVGLSARPSCPEFTWCMAIVSEVKAIVTCTLSDLSTVPAETFYLNLDDGTCRVDISNSGNIKNVQVNATSTDSNLGTVVKKLQAKVDVTVDTNITLDCLVEGDSGCF